MSAEALLPRDVATRDGRRCRLRAQRESDAVAIVAMGGDPGRSVLEEQVAVTALLAEEGLGVVAEAAREGIIGHLVVSGPRRPDGGGEVAIFVESSWRQGGVGRALLILAVEWATVRHLDQLRVRVDSSNHAAIALYADLGFVSKSGPAALELLMELPL